MPMIKDAPVIGLTRLILGRGINSVKLAEYLDCTRPTAMQRIRNPQDLTIGEVRQLSAKAEIPLEEFWGAIK